jgi:hypothetical protein
MRRIEDEKSLAAEASERAREEAEREQAWIARQVHVEPTWENQRRGLAKLNVIARELERVHRSEEKSLRQRDYLVGELRRVGVGWDVLSTSARLSRQALLKRL